MAIKVFGPDACLPAAIDANQATTQEGALVLLRSGNVVATFAPGFWSFWTKEEEPDNRSKILTGSAGVSTNIPRQ